MAPLGSCLSGKTMGNGQREARVSEAWENKPEKKATSMGGYRKRRLRNAHCFNKERCGQPGPPMTGQWGKPQEGQEDSEVGSSVAMLPLTQETTLPLKHGRRALSSEISSFTTLWREQSGQEDTRRGGSHLQL